MNNFRFGGPTGIAFHPALTNHLLASFGTTQPLARSVSPPMQAPVMDTTFASGLPSGPGSGDLFGNDIEPGILPGNINPPGPIVEIPRDTTPLPPLSPPSSYPDPFSGGQTGGQSGGQVAPPSGGEPIYQGGYVGPYGSGPTFGSGGGVGSGIAGTGWAQPGHAPGSFSVPGGGKLSIGGVPLSPNLSGDPTEQVIPGGLGGSGPVFRGNIGGNYIRNLRGMTPYGGRHGTPYGGAIGPGGSHYSYRNMGLAFKGR